MKSTFSIFAAAALFSLCMVQAAENYSLWPRRPAELEQARRLVAEKKGGEAVHLIQPYLHENGIAGREARQIAGGVNVPRYLSRLHPKAQVYTVQRGDTLVKIAATQKCPMDLLMLLNGVVDPGGLKIGQKLVLVPMELRMEIRPKQREICVWHGETLVADYNLTAADGLKKNAYGETELAARDGYLQGARLPARSFQYPASDRVLVLANGITLAGEQALSGTVLRMNQRELNELALLLGVGNSVSIIDDTPAAGK